MKAKARLSTREDVEIAFDQLAYFYDLNKEVTAADLYTIYKNPYHNDYHIKCVTVACGAGASHMNLSFDDTRDLLTAAIFHDYGHSGGKKVDYENVAIAVDRVNLCIDDKRRAAKICRMIESTVYPFTEQIVPYPAEIKILRDADLTQSLMPDWEKMYRGLQLEVSLGKGQVINDAEWCNMTNEFYKNVTIFTPWLIETVETFRLSGAFDKTRNDNNIHHGWLDHRI